MEEMYYWIILVDTAPFPRAPGLKGTPGLRMLSLDWIGLLCKIPPMSLS
jgi:hypothetical protein